MSSLVSFFQESYEALYASLGNGVIVIALVFGFIGVVAQWKLYEKAGQPGIASVVPIWNFIVFLRVVGRPASHIFLFLIPVYGQLYMIPKVYIELCNSFGKHTLIDYILIMIFNGFYILNLGLSYDTEYEGPAYGIKQATRVQTSSSNSALA